ncbi:expressed unknown protein [Seminavis robusta]|uniref:Uncharacterized protein n=1 Tax=Seminavis robusta TaxID=568900 RepID=A0A9N8HSD2_9STRA|nr:expressed unknown protein [Seminavis robusta]|eukprot:Sro1507_g278330.1 n/a (221) ;mRNA; r:5401-6063
MASLFCCLKSRQAAKFADSMNRAEDMAKKETVQFNKDIQQSLINKVAQKDLVVPRVAVGRHPKAEFRMTAADEQDGSTVTITGTIHFQCATGCEKHTTCSGENHNITGSGEYADGSGRTIEITQGSWSPAGYCFWIEKKRDASNTGNDEAEDDKKSPSSFVIHDFAHEDCQTVTTLEANGSKTRSTRTFQLLVDDKDDSNTPQPLCPSVYTALDLGKHEK